MIIHEHHQLAGKGVGGYGRTGSINAEPHHRHALGADAIRQDFHRVADEETRPRKVVKHVVQVDHGDDGVGSGRGMVDIVACGADRPHDERDEHARRRDQEEPAAADLVDEETHGQGDDQVEDVQAAVDEVLLHGVGVAHRLEDLLDVVRHQPVARPLREEPCRDTDEDAVPVALGADQLHPAVALELLLQPDRLLDLVDLQLHHLVVLVAIGVGVRHHFQCLLVLALVDEEPRRLGHEPDEDDLDDGRERLHHGRGTPRPVIIDVVGAEREPCSDNSTQIPGG